MAQSADISLSGEMYTKILEISTILGDLSSATEYITSVLQDIESLSNYQGSSSEELIVYYTQLKNHVDTMSYLYGMALQQAFNSFIRIAQADAAGGGL